MTVKELRKLLETAPEDAEVGFWDTKGEYLDLIDGASYHAERPTGFLGREVPEEEAKFVHLW